MRKELLSIGEVATMKNISIKGLRYYEKIGILTPAYINPETGYRYYSMSQMIDIDIISTCLDLDIPLKSLARHLTSPLEVAHGTLAEITHLDTSVEAEPSPSESSSYSGPASRMTTEPKAGEPHAAPILDLESLLLEGQSIAIEKIRRSQAALERINSAMREIKGQRSVAHLPEPYARTIDDCMLLCVPWTQDTFTGKDYVRAVTSLYRVAEKNNIVPLYTQGMVHHIHPQAPGWAVYVEAHIPDYVDFTATGPFTPLPQSDRYFLSHLEQKTYQGHRIVRENFESCFQALFSACEGTDSVLIASDIWSVDPHHYLVEVLEDRRISLES